MKKSHLPVFDVLVVGAGASGMLAAGRAAELGGRVLILEKMDRPGRKLLITGKGRCNITNDAAPSEFFNHIHPNGRFLKHAFHTFFSQDIISLLHRYGVETTLERGGRVFPATNRSSDVVEAILRWVREQGAEIRYSQKVEDIIIRNRVAIGVVVNSEGERTEFSGSHVILCAGGSSYPATGSSGDGYRMGKAAGHHIDSPRPALVPLETTGNHAQRLQGLSLRNVNVSMWVNGKKCRSEFGELLFTHFGVSGPVILTMSRFVVEELMRKNRVEISIDLKPALDEVTLDHRLIRDLNEHGKKRLENIFRLWLPVSLIPLFLQELKLDGDQEGHQVTSKERRRIMMRMKDLRFGINGYRPFKEAIITAGGVDTTEINGKTMESKLVRNLYFAGEVINLDADTGGYNLQIAFSTGWLAGQSCMKKDQSD